MTSTVNCPYCNAYVAVPAGTAAGQRVPCPRCGELFAYRPPVGNGFGAATPPGPTVTAATTQAPTRTGLSNWVIAGIVLGMMFVAAGVALWFALRTVEDRRQQ